MTYDGLDRPKTTSATNLGTITQNYDAGGRRTSLVDTTTGTTTFTPDGLGRIKQVNAPNTLAVNYTYNGRGDRTKIVYPSPNNTTFNYTYLNDGRLQQVTQGTGLTPVARYNYDAVGRVVQAVSNTNAALNSQLITNYRYDGADRLRALRSSEAGTTVSGFQYDTDRLGLRTTITETLPLSPTLSSTRIKTMTFDGGSLTDAATGADSTLPNPTTLTLTTTGALKGSSALTISLAASRVQVGATVSSNILAITADEITIDTAGFAQPSVNSLRANASPEASNTAESTATAIDPLTQQATDTESTGRLSASARLPITFIPNAGQTDPSVRMQARGLHGNLFFGAGELTLALRPPTRDKTPAKPANPL